MSLRKECPRTRTFYNGDEILIVTVGNKFIEAEAAAKKINAGLINLRIINPLPGEFLLKAFKPYKNSYNRRGSLKWWCWFFNIFVTNR